MSIPPTATIGMAKAEIENSPNHNKATYNAQSVVPILAPMMTPIAFGSAITPAPTNQRRSREIKLLLCNTDVTNDQVVTDLIAPWVYFSR
jgi:hypothetical protein